jgi:hypothetical protein
MSEQAKGRFERSSASVRQIGVIRLIKEHQREFVEEGGPDREAEDIQLALSAGLSAAKVRAIWGPVKGRAAEPPEEEPSEEPSGGAPDGAFKSDTAQPEIERNAQVAGAVERRLRGLIGRKELERVLRLEPGERVERLRGLLVETFGEPKFDVDKSPRGFAQSMANALKTVDQFGRMGLRCRYDIFHDKLIIGMEGAAQDAFPGFDRIAGDVDKIVLRMRMEALRAFGFDPGATPMREAIELACLDNVFNPVLDYLDGLRWDGRPRLNGWLTTYCGAKATELNGSIGRKVLVAAVRRIRLPVCKFDFTMALENPMQGLGRGTALRVLAGDENFSDAPIIGDDKREQQELIKGVWIYELGELEGMSRVNSGKMKAFLSRQCDSARPAYGRVRVDRPRMCVFVGTTNDDEYLTDPTGNRRYWPVFVEGAIWSPEAGRLLIDLEGLKRDRDQLWAEAAAVERSGEPLHIPERLWGVAEIESPELKEARCYG